MSDTRLRYDKDTGEYRVRYSSPIEPFIAAAKKRREAEEHFGVKRDAQYRFVGSVPMTVVMEIKEKHGVDLMNLRDSTERRKAFRIIEQEYPLLKGTNMRIG